MLNYIIKRLLNGFLVMFGVITLIFVLFNILPADPARMMLGQRADVASIDAINKDLGRDKPLLTQYFNYLNDLSPISVHNESDANSYWYLDSTKYSSATTLFHISSTKVIVLKKPYLRRSYQSKREVASVLGDAIPATFILAITAMAFAVLLGGWIGIMAAIRKNSFFDRAALVLASMGMSLPSFFMAVLIGWFFAFVLHEYTGLNMYGSLYTIDDFGNGEYLDLKNLILPALTLGIRPLSIIIQLTRNSMLEVLSMDYIRTARAKGLSSRTVLYRHALRNALNPVITAISGWFASLLAGAVFVEFVFDWKGIGVVIVQALEKFDFPVVMGAVLLISLLLVFVNIIVDILYGWLDPRIRYA
ncbi:MAG: ABC transporter permease [Bacteroidetes bacterium]|nr:ABC transporter permease [Bacteroidota bacterium]MBU1719692.1 ABC transporter permease [Bacteroidota bacterium]